MVLQMAVAAQQYFVTLQSDSMRNGHTIEQQLTLLCTGIVKLLAVQGRKLVDDVRATVVGLN
jgi:hypothetical protein